LRQTLAAALLQVPLAMDCTEQHILIASAPLQLLVLQLEGPPAAAAAAGANLLPAGRSSAGLAAGAGQRRLVAVRELSMFNVGRPVQDVALVSPAAADMAKRVLRGAWVGQGFCKRVLNEVCAAGPGSLAARLLSVCILWHHTHVHVHVSYMRLQQHVASALRCPAGYDSLRPSTAGTSSNSRSSSTSPCHAVLLRWGGLMSVLDLGRGAELVLADEVGASGQQPRLCAAGYSRQGKSWLLLNVNCSSDKCMQRKKMVCTLTARVMSVRARCRSTSCERPLARRLAAVATAAGVLLLQVESFWLSATLAVSAAGASSSRAGSTSASAPQSRSSSMHNLAGLSGSSEAGTAAAAAGVPEAAASGLAAAWEAATSSSVEAGPTGGSEGEAAAGWAHCVL
jgi:hypothetical protein